MVGIVSIKQISTFCTNFRLERKFLIPIVAVLFLGFSALAIEDAEASHFRYGTISWKIISDPPGPGATVEFTGNQGIRLMRCADPQAPDPPIGNRFLENTFDFGDGTDVIEDIWNEIVAKNNMDPDPLLRWCFAKIIGDSAGNPLVHTYTTDGPFDVELFECCRTAAEKNNPGDSFKVSTIVDLRNSVQVPDGQASPITVLSPITQCLPNAVCMFTIPAIDPDGDTLEWRLSTSTEADSLTKTV